MNLRKRWNAFWFVPYPARLLSLFRITLCALFFFELASNNMVASFLGGNEARYFAHGFYAPYVAWFAPPPYPVYLLLTRLLFFFIFTAMIGLFTRASLLFILSIFYYLFFLNKFFYLNHFYSYSLALFLCAFMPCGEVGSCDAWIKRLRGGGRAPETVISWAARLMQVTVSIIYLGSATSKLNPAWISGEALKIFYEVGTLQSRGVFRLVAGIPFAWQARGAIATEYFLAFGLWRKKTRFFALIVGVLFHIFLNDSMKIGQFSFQVFVFYLLFLNPLANGRKKISPQS